MQSKHKVELALRAAHVARVALVMLDCHFETEAKWQMEVIAKAVMELDQFVKALEE